jgi:UDPglucose 6-dehydrogenase
MREPAIFIGAPKLRRDVASIAMVGLGPVGLCSGVAFATQGHRVFGVDIDPERRKHIADGKPPFYEKGIEAALQRVLRQGRLSVVETVDEAIAQSSVVFLCVGTPSRADGSMDDSALGDAVTSLAAGWRDEKRRAVIVKSTVLPGTTDHLVRPILEAANRPFRLGVNPEFLREGHALEDALKPDRIILGTDLPETARIMKGLYRSARCPVLLTDFRTAETIKYATNAFLATKVAFADELANLCDAFGVSYDEVHKGLGLDPRINPRFLVPGVGFGGSCFTKDVRALVAAGRQRGAEPRLLEAVLAQNEVQYLRSIAFLEEELGDLHGKRIALLGLAFKGDTDDIRETRAVPIARTLLSKGAFVVGYDPLAGPAFSKLVPEAKIVERAKEALEEADGVILQADWPAFSRLTAKDFLSRMATPVVVDGRRILDPRKMKGIRFHRVG